LTDFFFCKSLRTQNSNTERSVIHRKDKIPFIVQPETQHEKNIFMNNHQGIKHNYAVKFSYRHMRFADIFLSTRKINMKKLNLRNRCYDGVSRVYRQVFTNRGGNVNLEIDID
jgi:hypothetical protein